MTVESRQPGHAAQITLDLPTARRGQQIILRDLAELIGRCLHDWGMEPYMLHDRRLSRLHALLRRQPAPPPAGERRGRIVVPAAQGTSSRGVDLAIDPAELQAQQRDLQARCLDLQRREVLTTRLLDRVHKDEQALTTRRVAFQAWESALDRAGVGLNARQTDLERAETQLRRRVQEHGQYKARLQRQLQEAAEQERRLDARRTRLEADERDLAGRVADVRRAVELCQARAGKLDSREQKLEALQRHLDNLQLRLQSRDNELQAREQTAMAEAAERAAQLEQKETELDAQHQDVQRQIAQLQVRMARLDEALRCVKSREVRAAGCDADLDRRQAELARRGEQSDRREHDVKIQLERLERARSDLSRRTGNLDTREQDLQTREEVLAAKRAKQVESQALMDQLAAHLHAWEDQLRGLERFLRNWTGHLDDVPKDGPVPDRPGGSAGRNSTVPAPRRPDQHALPTGKAESESSIEVLRRLGATGTDEELSFMLSRNPLEAAPSGV